MRERILYATPGASNPGILVAGIHAGCPIDCQCTRPLVRPDLLVTRGALDSRTRHQPGQATPVIALALLSVAACSPPAPRIAPFRARPDSVRAGELTGPFDGRVVDESTGQPIAGALVAGTWIFETGIGFQRPAGYHEVIRTTDAGGGYRMPSLNEVPLRDRDSVRLTSFHLVVYKKGYAAYRSDRRFRDFGPRLDFVQHQNRVALAPWQGDMSHVRHLRYVGGGAVLAALTRWETELAVAELRGGVPAVRPPDPGVPSRVVAGSLLTQETVARVTGYTGNFQLSPLKDAPASQSYSSQHFQAVGQSEEYDLAIRMWTEAPTDAQRRFDNLGKTLPGAQPGKDLGSASLRTQETSILGLAFLDQNRGVVILLTCGKKLCASMDTLVQLGRAAEQVLSGTKTALAEAQ